MNKRHTINIAIVFMVAASANSVFAQTGIEIYGRLNVDVESIKFDKPTGGVPADLTKLSSNSSRLGFRGAEDLGDGLSAIYQIESSVNPDSGSGTLAGRDTFVGLKGQFGKVRFGFFDDVFKGMGEYTDRFKGTGIQNDGTIAALGGDGNGFTRKQLNSMRFDTATYNGFRGEIQYGLENEAAVSPKTALTSAVHFHNGPLKIGAAYAAHKNFTLGKTDKAYFVGLLYDFGNFDIAGGMTRLDYSLNSGNIVHDYFTISTGIKAGAGVISLKYGVASDGKGSAPDRSVTAAGSDGARVYKGSNSGAKLYTFGYEYNLSKRSQLFAYYTRISNDANANYRFGTNGVNIDQAGPGASPSGYVMGIVHSF